MKTYVLSFAASIKHEPEHPERTAKSSLEWDVKFQVWPNRESMLKTCEMQRRGPPRSNHWIPCVKPLNR